MYLTCCLVSLFYCCCWVYCLVDLVVCLAVGFGDACGVIVGWLACVFACWMIFVGRLVCCLFEYLFVLMLAVLCLVGDSRCISFGSSYLCGMWLFLLVWYFMSASELICGIMVVQLVLAWCYVEVRFGVFVDYVCLRVCLVVVLSYLFVVFDLFCYFHWLLLLFDLLSGWLGYLFSWFGFLAWMGLFYLSTWLFDFGWDLLILNLDVWVICGCSDWPVVWCCLVCVYVVL